MDQPTIIITGASRGLGAAAARLAARMGANVVLNARSDEALETVAAEIRQAGRRALSSPGQTLTAPGDISRREDCRRLVEQALERFGRLDAIVNNAGVIEPIAPVAQVKAQAWEKSFAVNLHGPVWLVQAALPHLRETRGRVINVSSGAAANPIPGWAAYSAAKAALNHFTRSLAIEEQGITAIAFRPGVVDTEMQVAIRSLGASGMPERAYNRFVQLHQKGQLLPPELPGRALAALALYAPPEWSGEFIQWDEERVQALISLNSDEQVK